ncbi:hypothetical protein BH11GEM2_BH11GEM2_26610 [soil metagenome]
MSDERTDVVFGAKIADLLAGMKEAQVAVKESVTGIKEQMERVNGAVAGMRSAFLALTAVLAGGEMFEGVIEHTAELGASLEVLSTKTGIAADELSRLRFAATISEVSAGALDTGLVRMSRSMGAAAKGTGDAALAYAALGIQVNDAEGHLRPIQQVLLEVADKFHGAEDGAAKTAIAMKLFGRSGADLIPLLNQGSAEIAKLESESDRLGNTMSQKTVAASVEYVEAMKRVKATTHGFSQAVATEVMPVLSGLANSFTDSGVAAGSTNVAVDVIAGTFRSLAATVMGLKYTFDVLWEQASFVLNSIGDTIGRVAAAVDLAVHGQFGAAKEAMVGIADDIANNWDKMADDVTVAQQQISDNMTKLFGFGPPNDKHEGPKEGGKGVLKVPGDDKEKSTQLADAEAEWQAIKDGSTANADELLIVEQQFWSNKLAQLRKGEKDTESATLAMNGKRLAAEHRLSGDIERAAMIEAQTRRDAMLADLDVEKQSIEERRGLRELDANEAEAQLIELSQRSLAIKLEELDAEMALADGDWKKQAEIERQIAAAKRTSGREIATISKQTTLEIAKGWDQTLGYITDAIRKSFDGVIMGTQTLRDALRNLNRNMLLDFMASKAAELRHHLAVEKAKAGATWVGVIARVAAEAWAAVQSVAVSAWSALVQIANFAAIAAAAAWAAISAIPFVGPFLAPAAAAGTAVAVLGLAGSIKSASGGYDIPAGINPMTQLHAQEVVLPAELANKVRNSTGGGEVHNHFHVKGWDSKDMGQFVRENASHFADGVVRAARDNHNGLSALIRRGGA